IDGKTQFKIPAPLSPEMTGYVQKLAVDAYKTLECSGMARIDFFLEDKTEKLFLSEINTIPGFTDISMYPKLWEASGIPFPELLNILIDLGISRHKHKKRKGIHFKP
ncbi:MAG: D-alanine--D-alanine ligase A, partial [Candidatus Aminicenantes bacterium]|nr:D-alanine--D-alanine ligase A [Candidatus Aminicenantes bacterium]